MGFRNGHYETALPFKDRKQIMPNNRAMADQRLLSLKRKMERNQKFKEDYIAFMEKQIRQGHAEKVVKDNINYGRTWYIPHHGVYNPNKPNKIRVVFDCAAKYQGIALNDVLLQGPDLTNSLIGVLVRFRQNEIALMSDVEGMFLQVKVPEYDRDFMRFLWWEDGNMENEPSIYRMTCHLFGATSSPSCANLALQRTATDVGERYPQEVVTAIKRNFYVDDCLVSVETEAKGMELAKGLRELCAERGFRLTKWISNSRAVLESIPINEQAPEFKTLDLDNAELPSERALGVCWSAETDKLGFDIKLPDKPPTRRGLLSVISSVFDPLGLVSPFVLPAKLILQELCRKGSGWDDKIYEVDFRRWQQWLDELKRLQEWNMPRCYISKGLGEIASRQLHVFSDASEKGYGMAAYMRYEDKQGKARCSLVLARSRVTPLKHVTVPRLELTAATMAVRVITKMLLDKLDGVDETVYWTDSQTVLRYLNNTTARFKTFVANRVTAILDASSPTQWKYVRSANNPADEASRGMKVDEFLKNDRWTHGPEFLQKSSVEWEKWQESPALNVISLDDPELKRAVAWLLAIKGRLRQRVSFRKSVEKKYENEPDSKEKTKKVIAEIEKWNGPLNHSLNLLQLQVAEKEIINHEQQKYFKEEILALKTGNNGLIARAMRGSTKTCKELC
ncbi:uncharacterized protein [Antedon mediterranea]|uniref:uncharacterized protein n=1 Tax=Antedon mediterranea TaxID=105859 RepID=UPI003AF8BE15